MARHDGLSIDIHHVPLAARSSECIFPSSALLINATVFAGCLSRFSVHLKLHLRQAGSQHHSAGPHAYMQPGLRCDLPGFPGRSQLLIHLPRRGDGRLRFGDGCRHRPQRHGDGFCFNCWPASGLPLGPGTTLTLTSSSPGGAILDLDMSANLISGLNNNTLHINNLTLVNLCSELESLSIDGNQVIHTLSSHIQPVMHYLPHTLPDRQPEAHQLSAGHIIPTLLACSHLQADNVTLTSSLPVMAFLRRYNLAQLSLVMENVTMLVPSRDVDFAANW